MEVTLDTLADIDAIKQLKARYFRTVDTFDLDGWLTCFTEDCRLKFDGDVQRRGAAVPMYATLEGHQDVVDFWNGNTNRLASVHHGHTPEIQIVSQTEARGVWAMEDIVEFTDSQLHGYGHYHETYRKESDGQWRIATLHLTRLKLTQTARTQADT
ncbi:MAG: nuclear transport factor 2 family protein [Novosphingobium sp.]|nr:nuclear transport factor 2 family protein [Novosphingobium sp.]